MPKRPHNLEYEEVQRSVKPTAAASAGSASSTSSSSSSSSSSPSSSSSSHAPRGARGPFATVRELADFIANRMKTPRGTPKFSAAETAKDLAYVPGAPLLAESAGDDCSLGPGAEKGLAFVRKERGAALPGDEHAAVAQLLRELRGLGGGGLAWMRAIDVEQSLCEFSKYRSRLPAAEGKPPSGGRRALSDG